MTDGNTAAAPGSGISDEAALKILKVRAQALDECAEEVVLDRPDLFRKWTLEARQLRITAGEDPGDEHEE